VFQAEPLVARCESPVKVYGSLYGQFNDLMRFFSKFKGPNLHSLDN